MHNQVTRLVKVKVSRTLEFEVTAHRDASINTLVNLAHEDFCETQDGFDESANSKDFGFQLVVAPIIS